jgi:predicted PurR-regulated permease PerM
VLATVFFAATIAYVATPARRWLTRRGLPPWWAAAATTAGVFLAAAALLAPLVMFLYLRLGDLSTILSTLPAQFDIELLGFVYRVDRLVLLGTAERRLTAVGVDIASRLPVLTIKLTLFGFVVFALLLAGAEARSAVWTLVPPAYDDIAAAYAGRARRTLAGIYVVQGATALATFAVAVPLFALLGYRSPFVLAFLAGVLQFLPVVGPSLLFAAIAAGHLLAGDALHAAVIAVLGFVLVGWLPDAFLRPQLARASADLRPSLYFIGFVGGLFSLGPVGIIAGPLAVAMLVETGRLIVDHRAENGQPAVSS